VQGAGCRVQGLGEREGAGGVQNTGTGRRRIGRRGRTGEPLDHDSVGVGGHIALRLLPLLTTVVAAAAAATLTLQRSPPIVLRRQQRHVSAAHPASRFFCSYGLGCTTPYTLDPRP